MVAQAAARWRVPDDRWRVLAVQSRCSSAWPIWATMMNDSHVIATRHARATNQCVCDATKVVVGRESLATEVEGIYPRPKWSTLVPPRFRP